MDEKTGNYWKILETTLEWIRYSDAKATAILTIYGIIVTVVFSKFEEVMNLQEESSYLWMLMMLPLLSSLVAIFYGFRCINPRMEKSDNASIMFFGSITKRYKTEEEFRQATHKVLDSKVGLDDDLAHQIFINSRVAYKKFRDVSLSIRFFVISIVLTIVVLVLLSINF